MVELDTLGVALTLVPAPLRLLGRRLADIAADHIRGARPGYRAVIVRAITSRWISLVPS